MGPPPGVGSRESTAVKRLKDGLKPNRNKMICIAEVDVLSRGIPLSASWSARAGNLTASVRQRGEPCAGIRTTSQPRATER
ncbi:hypothetical protein AERO9A_250089 [Aeromonas salmonicida]|nr:hypothetical protein AERO9A_250089 [Aeromonas salmonicida]